MSDRPAGRPPLLFFSAEGEPSGQDPRDCRRPARLGGHRVRRREVSPPSASQRKPAAARPLRVQAVEETPSAANHGNCREPDESQPRRDLAPLPTSSAEATVSPVTPEVAGSSPVAPVARAAACSGFSFSRGVASASVRAAGTTWRVPNAPGAGTRGAEAGLIAPYAAVSRWWRHRPL